MLCSVGHVHKYMGISENQGFSVRFGISSTRLGVDKKNKDFEKLFRVTLCTTHMTQQCAPCLH